MKSKIIALFMLASPMFTFASNPQFEAAMGSALQKFGAAESMEEIQQVANQFQVIAKAESKEWLPLYYHAQCYILMSFQETEVSKKDELLDIAESSINAITKVQPAESEIYVLQAFMYTARLTIDPASRGQKYMGLSSQANGKALAMNPNNPRAQYLSLANEMGMAQFFGKDVSEACAKAKALLEKWDSFESPSSIHPKWGKNQLAGLSKGCK